MDINELKTHVMGFNRKNFVEKIISEDFDGNIEQCALALDINKKYLYSLVFYGQSAGRSILDKIYKYCRKTNRDPEEYIFVKNKEQEEFFSEER